MAKKLQYFGLPGLAEALRYILHYTGQKFHDDRLDYTTWPNKEIKDSLPFGQLPLYQEGERVLHQSLAIGRYLAANTDLLPSDPWEQAVLDAAVLTIYDYHKHVIASVVEKDPKKKEELQKQILEELLDFYFSRLDKQVQVHGFLGKKLSWADLVFVGIIETSNLIFKTNIEKNFPAITELMNKVRKLPGIAEYIKKREPWVFKPRN